MDDSKAFSINDEEISHNAFDDETIVIHFTTGNYFSLRESASAIWAALEKGPVTAGSLAAAFDESNEKSVSELHSFLSELAEKQLVQVANDSEVDRVKSLGSYRTPKVEVFEDMQGMLLADVIHDTDESGWPNMA